MVMDVNIKKVKALRPPAKAEWGVKVLTDIDELLARDDVLGVLKHFKRYYHFKCYYLKDATDIIIVWQNANGEVMYSKTGESVYIIGLLQVVAGILAERFTYEQ
jgi:hypothetical protein